MNKVKDITENIKKQYGFSLPIEYIDYIQKNGGKIIYNEFNELEFWSVIDLIKINEEYEVKEFASDYFFIASNLCGAGLAFNVKNLELYALAFVGMSNEDAVFVAEDFKGFIENFEKEEVKVY